MVRKKALKKSFYCREGWQLQELTVLPHQLLYPSSLAGVRYSCPFRKSYLFHQYGLRLLLPYWLFTVAWIKQYYIHGGYYSINLYGFSLRRWYHLPVSGSDYYYSNQYNKNCSDHCYKGNFFCMTVYIFFDLAESAHFLWFGG